MLCQIAGKKSQAARAGFETRYSCLNHLTRRAGDHVCGGHVVDANGYSSDTMHQRYNTIFELRKMLFSLTRYFGLRKFLVLSENSQSVFPFVCLIQIYKKNLQGANRYLNSMDMNVFKN